MSPPWSATPPRLAASRMVTAIPVAKGRASCRGLFRCPQAGRCAKAASVSTAVMASAARCSVAPRRLSYGPTVAPSASSQRAQPSRSATCFRRHCRQAVTSTTSRRSTMLEPRLSSSQVSVMSSSMSSRSHSLGARIRRAPSRALLSVLGLALVGLLALAGCGLGPGPTPGGISLSVTQDFGALPVGYAGTPRVSGQETVMSLLMRNYDVKTRYGGGFVESVNGHAGGTHAGDPIDWFYYGNGGEPPKGPADTNVRTGDRIWWDLHDWSQTDSIPAVVGSFPEPFVGGIEGKRYPVRVECSEPSSSACATVHTRLSALGVPVAGAAV